VMLVPARDPGQPKSSPGDAVCRGGTGGLEWNQAARALCCSWLGSGCVRPLAVPVLLILGKVVAICRAGGALQLSAGAGCDQRGSRQRGGKGISLLLNLALYRAGQEFMALRPAPLPF